jgi:hypothetical protein
VRLRTRPDRMRRRDGYGCSCGHTIYGQQNANREAIAWLLRSYWGSNPLGDVRIDVWRGAKLEMKLTDSRRFDYSSKSRVLTATLYNRVVETFFTMNVLIL